MSKSSFSYEIEEEPLFLNVKSRHTVLVGNVEICKVLTFVGDEKDPLDQTIFQVANVNRVEIKSVHGAEVKEIVCSLENVSTTPYE